LMIDKCYNCIALSLSLAAFFKFSIFTQSYFLLHQS
jgi:hypothetical protein